MIDARELRIGNYVNVPILKQCPFRIDSIEHLHPRDNFGKFGMYYDEFPNGHPLTWYLKDLTPIPLTEEWLVRFGFEKINTTWYAYKGGNFRLNISFDVEWANNWMGIRLKHVNSLQNLYFALTGKELELKQ